MSRPADEEPIIRLQSVSKVFQRPGTGEPVAALQDIDLEIARGEIYAVIGFSGAGKSTLVRLFNALETPTSGSVVVDGRDLTKLSAKQIRSVRAGIGMVFQQFNLMRSRTVYDNLAFPLEVAGWNKQQIEERITELLHFVSLSSKAWSYPDELSGGQKQRIGIARALATRPPILLADESTSALDPDTTREVLALLRRAHEELGVTIVVITHEMDVVRTIADRVAVLDSGRLVETGSVEKIFTDPQQPGTRRLIGATLTNVPQQADLDRLRSEHSGRLVVLTPTEERGLGRLLGDAGRRKVQFEIVHGGITVTKGRSLSTFTLALQGETGAVDGFITELKELGALEEAS